MFIYLKLTKKNQAVRTKTIIFKEVLEKDNELKENMKSYFLKKS